MTAAISVAEEEISVEAVRRSRWEPLIFGPPDRPRWERPGLLALLIVTAVVYLWGLGGAGWTNPYYAAAVQSGTQSWKALLFASLDPQNAITVDKPPAAMWVMALSGRVFGFNSWSMLAPEALMGVAAVGLLFATVRRWAGPAAGLLAGTVLAVTPVAAMMFRYDNPDALLTLVLVGAAYCTVRAVDEPGARWWSAGTGWLVGAGLLMGLGFLTKMMQAFLVLPGLALVVLVAGAGGILSRITKLATAGAALVVSAGWYVALVELWPADSRPFIGGSTSNSLWELAVDYNGLGRVFGNHGGGGHPAATPHPMAAPPADAVVASGGGGQMRGGFGGFGDSHPGVTRLFHGELATEFSWLLPAALIALVAGLWFTRRVARTDRVRAGLLLWGGWLLVTAAVLSFMSRSFHSYYSVMLAPAIAALVAIGATQLWQRRDQLAARIVLALMLVGTGAWTFALLNRTPDWLPWLRWSIVVLALAAAVMVLGRTKFRRYGLVIAGVAVFSALIGPTVYTLETVAQTQAGGSPIAGPPRSSDEQGGRDGGSADPQLDGLITGANNRWAAAAVGASQVSAIELRTGASLLAVGGFSGRDESPTLEQFQSYVADHQVGYYLVQQRKDGGRRSDTESTSAQITAWVKANFPATTMGNMEVYRLDT
ncbi:MAG: putative mannosyltransferase YkcB [Nocardia sp.]|uniref:ArnT family glycosyltransferase n=1 Tax=Nocardia sp. TaxID=1821 RepID=UPI002603B64F|nr:glycosyltransferase family 39 protein [Nocardia sp.]MCU1643336.1 putative mannosyltransferase YkcB [Nocardia sp.]